LQKQQKSKNSIQTQITVVGLKGKSTAARVSRSIQIWLSAAKLEKMIPRLIWVNLQSTWEKSEKKGFSPLGEGETGDAGKIGQNRTQISAGELRGKKLKENPRECKLKEAWPKLPRPKRQPCQTAGAGPKKIRIRDG